MPSIVERALLAKAMQQNVPSPCLSVCTLNTANDDLCNGCYRTLDEIAAWSVMNDYQKREVWSLIERRANWACQ